MFIGLYVNSSLLLSDFNEIELALQIFKNYCNSKFHENSSGCVPRCCVWKDGRKEGQRDRRTHMTKKIIAFRNFANAPKTQ
jgi:hypothetical protein